MTTLKAQIPDKILPFLEKVDTTELFWEVEQNPEYPGGRSAMINYFQRKLVYPMSVREKGIQGTIYVLFIVETNGKLKNIVATNSVNKQLDKAAVKLIRKMPKWNPAINNGEIVRVLNIQPVTFKLN